MFFFTSIQNQHHYLYCFYIPQENFSQRFDAVVPAVLKDSPEPCPQEYKIFFGQSRGFWQKIIKNHGISYGPLENTGEILKTHLNMDQESQDMLQEKVLTEEESHQYFPFFPGKILDEKEAKHHHMSPNNVYIFRLEKPEAFVHSLPQNLLDILYEDHDILVLDKPWGLPVHKGPGHHESLIDLLCGHCPGLTKEFQNLKIRYDDTGAHRPGIVHRLDKDTSGVMVVAKTKKALYNLGEQFAQRQVEKTYWAFVHGVPCPSFGTFEGALGRDTKNPLKRRVLLQGGKEAKTLYRTHDVRRTQNTEIEENQKKNPRILNVNAQKNQEFSWIICKPKTGRTHQIRVHLAHGGYPIVGDTLYGGRKNSLSRQALHAHELGFFHPMEGHFMAFQSPLPQDMDDFWKNLQ